MSSYAILRLGEAELSYSRNEPDPSILVIFCESDRRGDPIPGPEEDIPKELRVEYAAPLGVICDRLDLMGTTLAEAEAEFARGLAERIEEERKSEAFLREVIGDKGGIPFMRRALEEERQALATLTFAEWFDAFRQIVAGTVNLDYDLHDESQLAAPPLLRYMLRDRFGHSFGFPSVDYRCFLRVVAELEDLDLELVYDLSELVQGGWLQGDDAILPWARWSLGEAFALDRPIIVLTEGSSDRRFVSESMRLLFPHLHDYFAFMDFDEVRLKGGAGTLVATVKAFAAARIANRVIALFDNDTAARVALRGLDDVDLPRNIRILRCPDLPLARDYPTIGPTGVSHLDVNGLAGALELYFGEDVLREPSGELSPIQWRGFDETLGLYHGELLRKRELQKRFAKKLARCQDGTDEVSDGDWEGMRIVLDSIRTAFHDS